MSNETAAVGFTPGSYWTEERAEEAIARMNAVLASPAFQQEMRRTAEAYAEGREAVTPSADSPRLALDTPVQKERVVYRRGERRDVADIVALMMLTDLPPLFIEEFIGGFVIAEHEGEFLGCGGLEMYGQCGVIRSVATTLRGRGLGVGRRMAELLVEDAKATGASEIYLFTADAHAFWLDLGFADVTFDEWSESPRRCWQYAFLSGQPEMVAEIGVHGMRMRV